MDIEPLHRAERVPPDRSDRRMGVVRDRATGDAPAKVRLEVRTQASDPTPWEADPARAVVAHVDATPTAAGAFAATIPLDALPLSSYSLALVVDGETIREQWLAVTVIRKPAYRLAFDVDHRAVLAGEPVTATATATTYDGTPLPGIPIRFDTRGTEQDPAWNDDAALPTVSTGADGTATHGFRPATEGSISASTASVELGDISAGYLWLVAFPASVYVDIAKAARVGNAVDVTGSVRSVDLAAVEANLRADKDWRADVGPAAAGVRVTVRATPRIWVATREGTTYDFILKRTVPRYTYAEKELAPVTSTATTSADGSFHVRMTLPAAARGTDAWVDVRAEARDRTGRHGRRRVRRRDVSHGRCGPGRHGVARPGACRRALVQPGSVLGGRGDVPDRRDDPAPLPRRRRSAAERRWPALPLRRRAVRDPRCHGGHEPAVRPRLRRRGAAEPLRLRGLVRRHGLPRGAVEHARAGRPRHAEHRRGRHDGRPRPGPPAGRATRPR